MDYKVICKIDEAEKQEIAELYAHEQSISQIVETLIEVKTNVNLSRKRFWERAHEKYSLSFGKKYMVKTDTNEIVEIGEFTNEELPGCTLPKPE